MSNIARRIRARRDQATFDRAMRNASPTMRQELAAASARTQITLGYRRNGF